MRRIFNKFLILIFNLSLISNLEAQNNKLILPDKDKHKFDDQVYSWLSTLAQVLEILKTKSYHTPDLDECMTKALDSLMQFHDHNGLLSPKETKSLLESTSGEFCGIGVKIAPNKNLSEDFITIADIIEDGPAAKAGVKALDKIIAVNGQKLKKQKLDDIIDKIKGPRKTKVRLDIIRNGNIEDKDNIIKIFVERDIVKEENLSSYYLPDLKIYYLSLAMFSSQSAHLLESVLKKTSNQNIKGLILDLRENGGGILQSAIDILSLFVEKNSTVVVTKDKNGKIIESYKTKREPIAFDNFPVVILVNHGTASAAEILCGTLKNRPNIFIVGTQTYGKGSVQEIIPVNNNCALRCTIAEYFLENNTKIQGLGVTPDFVVEQKLGPTKEMRLIEELQRSDEQKNILNHEDENKIKTPKEKLKDSFCKDYQIKTAIQVVNIYNLLKNNTPEKLKDKNKIIKTINKYLIVNEKIKLEEVRD